MSIKRCQQAHMHMQTHTKKTERTRNHRPTQVHLHTYTHTLSLTHKQERTSYYLEISPDIACHSQRP